MLNSPKELLPSLKAEPSSVKMGIKLRLISENKPVRVELRANAGTAFTALVSCVCVHVCYACVRVRVNACVCVSLCACMCACVCWGFNSQVAWEHAEGEMSLLMT